MNEFEQLHPSLQYYVVNTLGGLADQLARVQHEVENGIKALNASQVAG